MEDTEATAALMAIAALTNCLIEAGAVDHRELTSALRLGVTNLRDDRKPGAAEALEDFVEGASLAWRVASTAGQAPN
ncbi:TPA: hypothetical protein ACKP7Q_001252 [Stenotrophomonas maltophilia]|nr:hypothetical protein [Stenotrophomonas maltophilia]